MQKALTDIKNGVLTVREASHFYKIPNQTLYDKINKKHTKQVLPGAPTVLKPDEEIQVAKWITHVTDLGFPVTKKLLNHSVYKLATASKRPLKFKEGSPGRSWFLRFVKKHSTLKGKVLKTLNKPRVDITEEETKVWFKNVSKHLLENKALAVLKDPSRIFCLEESAYYIGPKGQAVFVRKGTSHEFCRFGYIEKDSLTLSLGASADGKLMPTLAIFPCKNIQNMDKYPQTWSCGRSESRWMSPDNFYEYLANVFNPVLISENIKKPVALFLDGHTTYLSLQVTEFCRQNGILLIALVPSTNRILHPLEKAIFQDLKEEWRLNIHEWNMENTDSRLKREGYSLILEKAIMETLTPETIQNGFRNTGIYPFNENAIDYTKLSSAGT